MHTVALTHEMHACALATSLQPSFDCIVEQLWCNSYDVWSFAVMRGVIVVVLDERRTGNGNNVIVYFPNTPQIGVPKSESRWVLSVAHVGLVALCAGSGGKLSS